MKLTQEQIADFRKVVYEYFGKNKRDFPWRQTEDPYCILVSELMLQQTQTQRVITKYNAFLHAFPDIQTLAKASFRNVLEMWKGLGYNRRAKWLHEIAKIIKAKFNGIIPNKIIQLKELPGIGNATARSIAAFAYNKPTVFLETNIRTVLIHHFFEDRKSIDEKELLDIAAQVLDKEKPREWYSALMDYGSNIKEKIGNLSKKSKHYRRQSKFEGSDRQLRGKILEILLNMQSLSIKEICNHLQKDEERVKRIMNEMIQEHLIRQKGDRLCL